MHLFYPLHTALSLQHRHVVFFALTIDKRSSRDGLLPHCHPFHSTLMQSKVFIPAFVLLSPEVINSCLLHPRFYPSWSLSESQTTSPSWPLDTLPFGLVSLHSGAGGSGYVKFIQWCSPASTQWLSSFSRYNWRDKRLPLQISAFVITDVIRSSIVLYYHGLSKPFRVSGIGTATEYSAYSEYMLICDYCSSCTGIDVFLRRSTLPETLEEDGL